MLIDEKATLRSEGIFEWENELCDGLWSYSLASIERGVQYCFVTLAENYEKVEKGVVNTYKAIEKGVVNSYKKIEDTTVGTYKKIEKASVESYKRVEKAFVDTFLADKEEQE